MMQSANISAARARTKIVATVGPACRSEPQLQALYEAGADVFRLNAAHGELAEHQAVLDAIRRISDRTAHPIAVLVDLAGPKIRLGELAGGQMECRQGDVLDLVRGGAAERPGELVSNYERLIDELAVGGNVMLADGTVGMQVESLTKDRARLRVTQEGLIRSRQGINLPGAKLSLPAMSAADERAACWAADQGADFISLSFVRQAADVQGLRALVRGRGSQARIVAKIEKQEALDRLPDIVATADCIMVARGDLGVEIDVARMPVVQKEIVALCNRWQKPVIIATQMLDSMQHSRRPTRAETTDVANAILDGCDACMLSGETAIGEYPVAAVEMMNRIALATEPLYRRRPVSHAPEVIPEGLEVVTQAVIIGAGHVAQQLGARLIAVASHSGATALALAKQRNFVPTVGVSDNREALRRMCLYWGVIPLAGAPVGDSHELLAFLEAWARRDERLAAGDWIVLVAGNALASRGHDMIRAHQVGAATEDGVQSIS